MASEQGGVVGALADLRAVETRRADRLVAYERAIQEARTRLDELDAQAGRSEAGGAALNDTIKAALAKADTAAAVAP